MPIFQEIAYSETPIGEISLRRRTEPRADNQLVYEIKLGDEFLMSSLFTTGERALASLVLQRLKRRGASGDGFDIVVGGLGLGYTASAALDDPRTGSLIVVDLLGPVIEWHRQGLVPLGQKLVKDGRCRLICGDFFALATDPDNGFDYEQPARTFDAILLDIDHSTDSWLHRQNREFYTVPSLSCVRDKLRPGGQFAMWSNDPPVEYFLDLLREVFIDVEACVVSFSNPYQESKASCTIYLAAVAASQVGDMNLPK